MTGQAWLRPPSGMQPSSRSGLAPPSSMGRVVQSPRTFKGQNARLWNMPVGSCLLSRIAAVAVGCYLIASSAQSGTVTWIVVAVGVVISGAFIKGHQGQQCSGIVRCDASEMHSEVVDANPLPPSPAITVETPPPPTSSLDTYHMKENL